MNTPPFNDRVKNTIKEWLTPTLISAVGVMAWTQLSELRSDVKALLRESSATDAKLAMLEKEVDYLRSNVKYDDYQYQQPELRFPYDRAVPKKEEGPRVPAQEGTDKKRL